MALILVSVVGLVGLVVGAHTLDETLAETDRINAKASDMMMAHPLALQLVDAETSLVPPRDQGESR